MNKRMTFKQFLALDTESLIAEAKKEKKKIPKPKPRPKKILWFGDRNLWHNDLQFAHGGKFEYHHSNEEEEEARNVYATDPDARVCYGVWQGPQRRGVTFHKPRPLSAVKHPRIQMKKMTSGDFPVSNIR